MRVQSQLFGPICNPGVSFLTLVYDTVPAFLTPVHACAETQLEDMSDEEAANTPADVIPIVENTSVNLKRKQVRSKSQLMRIQLEIQKR